ncbi:hypothetical protein ACET3Z_002687 [Daucus carota]
MLDNEGDAQVFEPGPSKTKGKKGKKTPKRQQKTRAKSANVTLPAPITPKTAFKSLPVRKSPRFSPVQTNAATARPTVVTEHRLFKKKVPKTTARRKGLSTTQDDDSAGQTGNEENAFEEEQASDRVESSKKRRGGRSERKEIQDCQMQEATGKPLLIRNPRVRDQSNAAKAAKASRDTATQASQTNTTRCTPSQSQPQI